MFFLSPAEVLFAWNIAELVTVLTIDVPVRTISSAMSADSLSFPACEEESTTSAMISLASLRLSVFCDAVVFSLIF